jgi:hypothetical protein
VNIKFCKLRVISCNPHSAVVPNDKGNLDGTTDVTSGIKLFETSKK